MQQIASDLALSRFTVSAVVNGYAERRGISAQTIQRVEEYISQCGYVPSAHAVALQSGKQSAVGILHCGDLGSHLIQAFNMFAAAYNKSQDGIEIIISRPDEVISSLQNLLSRGIRQLIWIHSDNPRVEIIEDRRVAGVVSRVPTVIYNYHFTESDMDDWLSKQGVYLVGVSRRKGYRKMARFIKQLGHRAVYLGDVFSNESTTAGILSEQFVEAFAHEGLEVIVPAIFAPPGDSFSRGQRLSAIMAKDFKKKPFTAACFRDDAVAAVVIAGLEEQGISVPADVSVISFDDHPLASVFKVPLTTVRIPVAGMVRKTIELLYELPKQYRHCFPLELIERSSHRSVDERLSTA